LANGTAYIMRAVAISVPLVLIDLASVALSILLAAAVVGLVLPLDSSIGVRFALVLSAGLVGIKGAMGLYPAVGVPPSLEVKKSGLATLYLFGAFLLAGLLWGVEASAQWVLLIGGLVSLVASPALRFVTRKVLSRFSWWTQPLLIFGNGPPSTRLARYYSKRPELGLTPVLVANEPSRAARANRVVGTIGANGAGSENHSSVQALASRHHALCAAIPWDGASEDGPAGLLRESLNTFPHLLIVPETTVGRGSWKEVTDFGGVSGVRAGKGLLLPTQRAVKRVVDSAVAIMLGLVMLPILVTIAVVIRVTSPGPVFFGHDRIGRNRKVFRAWKFRSMHVNADELLEEHLASNPEAREEWAKDQKLKDDPRLTLVGRFLRRTSLDELPQLWNVICGDMSLVGPRPIVEGEVGKYGTEFERYMSVPPGITGLWQVSGRNNTTYEERIQLDATYVENWSLALDAYILGRTFEAVFTGEGAY
jgi:Undecaprenyl-phosphate galactose phosphotransferase WbaP